MRFVVVVKFWCEQLYFFLLRYCGGAAGAVHGGVVDAGEADGLGGIAEEASDVGSRALSDGVPGWSVPLHLSPRSQAATRGQRSYRPGIWRPSAPSASIV